MRANRDLRTCNVWGIYKADWIIVEIISDDKTYVCHGLEFECLTSRTPRFYGILHA